MRKNKSFRRAIVVLCLLTALSLCPLEAVAATTSYTPSAAYRASTYYQNLKNLPMTGDSAFDTVALALSQLAYHEGSGSAQFGGDGSSSGNFTEYNYAYGKVSGTYGYAWCAAFVSWCLDTAGVSDSAGGRFVSCTLWVEKLQSIGQYRTRSSGYEPKAGDLIFFRSAGVSRASDHVGLVRYVKDGRVYTVEGNSSDQVSLRDYSLKDTYIVGYGLPAYTGMSLRIDRLAAEDVASGWYVVSYSFVNVRSAASASATKRGSLQKRALVKVSEVKNGWGKIDYNGKVGYISLEYADFVTPLSYTLRYVSDGKAVHEVKHYSTQSLRVSSLSPELAGHRFLHWEDEERTVFRAADTIAVGERTLTAVFEELPQALPPAVEEDIPPDGAENEHPPTQDEHLPPGELGDAEQQTPPEAVAANAEAAVHAGVVSAILALALFGAWLRFSKKEE